MQRQSLLSEWRFPLRLKKSNVLNFTPVFILISQLLNDHHHIPNIPLPQQPDMPQGAEAISLSNSPWEFPRNRVDLQVVLGSGAFGLVMKGQAQGIKGCVGKMYVAVKIVKGKILKSASCRFFWARKILVNLFG